MIQSKLFLSKINLMFTIIFQTTSDLSDLEIKEVTTDLMWQLRELEILVVSLLFSVNAAIARNCNAKFDDKKGADAGDNWKKGKPIRVVRGYKGKKQSKYAPEEGCRYIKTFLFV